MLSGTHASYSRPLGRAQQAQVHPSGLRDELDRCLDNRSNLFAATHAAVLPTPHPTRIL
jgi:hypothetical protein